MTWNARYISLRGDIRVLNVLINQMRKQNSIPDFQGWYLSWSKYGPCKINGLNPLISDTVVWTVYMGLKMGQGAVEGTQSGPQSKNVRLLDNISRKMKSEQSRHNPVKEKIRLALGRITGCSICAYVRWPTHSICSYSILFVIRVDGVSGEPTVQLITTSLRVGELVQLIL